MATVGGVKVPLLRLSPFQQLDTVWESEDPAEQRKAVGNLLGVKDGPLGPTMQDHIKLDLAFAHLLFARDAGFNVGQTEAFYEIMTTLHGMLLADDCTQEAIFAEYRRLIMENVKGLGDTARSTKSEPDQKAPAVEAVEEATATVTKEEEAKEEDKAREQEAKAADDGGSKEEACGDEGAVAAVSTVPCAAKPASRQFVMENIKQITEYVTYGIFHHFSLYRTIHRAGFTSEAADKQHPVLIQTVVPDNLSLADAVDLDAEVEVVEVPHAEEAAEAEAETAAEAEVEVEAEEKVEVAAEVEGEGKDEEEPVPENIAALVEAEAKKARVEMEKMLAKQTNSLDQTFQKLESRKK